MTFAQLKTEALRIVGETPASPIFHTAANAGLAVNEAQALFSFLTLCVESSALIDVTARWFAPASSQAAYLAPLSLHRDWVRLMPIRFEDLEALSSTWRGSAGAPSRYMQAGWSKLGLWPSPDASYALTLRYARTAATLTADEAVPEIPVEFHRALLDYAVPRMRMLEGGDELLKEVPRLQKFFAAAKQQAEYVQARARRLDYDTSPTEKWFGFAEAKAWSTLRKN